MAFDIAIGQYHHANSVIHKLDGRIKITLVFVLIIAAFFANNFWGLTLHAALLIGIAALSNTHIKIILKAIAPLSFFLLFPLIFNLFFVSDGTVYVQWSFIRITDIGLERALFFTFRLFCMFFCTTLLTLSTSPITLCDSISAMLRPFARFGLPAYEISMMVSIALRFIPSLLEDFDRIKKAQMARGSALTQGGPIKRMKALIPLLVPLFALSLKHAEELALAMESRCYHGDSNRSHYREFKIRSYDIFACIACTAVFVVLIIWL